MSNPENGEWVAPLVRTMLSAPVISSTHGPMTCPRCGCDHQIFLGHGILSPDKTGVHLIAAFPTTETIAKIDMPADIKIGGLTAYTRYSCGCNGHVWAMFTAFLNDRSMNWCCDLTPRKKKAPKAQKGKAKKVPVKSGQPPGIMPVIEKLISGLKASGAKPMLVLGSQIVAQLTPEQIEYIKSQGVTIVESGQPLVSSAKGTADLPPTEKSETDDHENPLNRMKPVLRYAWQNFPGKERTEDELFKFRLPKLPVKHAQEKQPPHIAYGTNDINQMELLRDWLLGIAVDIKPETKRAIHALVYWDGVLLIVTNAAGEARKAVAEDVTTVVIGLNKFKPDLFMLRRVDYLALMRNQNKKK